MELNSRRQSAQEELGLTSQKEMEVQQRAIDKEVERQNEKERKRRVIETETSYVIIKSISKLMDGFYLDAILGFFIPGIGDILNAILTIPFIFVSLFKVKSITLTLAVIYNSLIDIAIGMIPILGDICDIFIRSYKKNYRLIVGYVEDDQEIIKQVRKDALKTIIIIGILCLIIYWLYQLIMYIYTNSFFYNL